MNNAGISQIFYSQGTRLNLDPGFIPFENVGNTRSDWHEYWPIRNYLQNNTLDENTLMIFSRQNSRRKQDLLQLDALKIAYAQTKRDEYLSLFLNIRNLISKK